MTPDEIEHHIAAAMLGVKSRDPAEATAAIASGAKLVHNFLANQQRIADSLEALASCVCQPNQGYATATFQTTVVQ